MAEISKPNKDSNTFAGYHRVGTSSIEIFWHDDNLDDPLRPSVEEAEDNSGWYWWACHPGCLPDGDQTGPFKTSWLALKDVDEPFAERALQESCMGPRKNPRQPIFRDHNCSRCRDGELPCAEGNYDSCSLPHARND